MNGSIDLEGVHGSITALVGSFLFSQGVALIGSDLPLSVLGVRLHEMTHSQGSHQVRL